MRKEEKIGSDCGEFASETWGMVARILPFVKRFSNLLHAYSNGEGRIRTGVAEVEKFERVGGEITGSVRLWKCVEKREERFSQKSIVESRKQNLKTESPQVAFCLKGHLNTQVSPASY